MSMKLRAALPPALATALALLLPLSALAGEGTPGSGEQAAAQADPQGTSPAPSRAGWPSPGAMPPPPAWAGEPWSAEAWPEAPPAPRYGRPGPRWPGAEGMRQPPFEPPTPPRFGGPYGGDAGAFEMPEPPPAPTLSPEQEERLSALQSETSRALWEKWGKLLDQRQRLESLDDEREQILEAARKTMEEMRETRRQAITEMREMMEARRAEVGGRSAPREGADSQ